MSGSPQSIQSSCEQDAAGVRCMESQMLLAQHPGAFSYNADAEAEGGPSADIVPDKHSLQQNNGAMHLCHTSYPGYTATPL